MCDSNHFTFPEVSRWSVLYSEINTLVNVALVKSSWLWGGRGREKKQTNMEKTTVGQALIGVVRCVDGLEGREIIC